MSAMLPGNLYSPPKKLFPSGIKGSSAFVIAKPVPTKSGAFGLRGGPGGSNLLLLRVFPLTKHPSNSPQTQIPIKSTLPPLSPQFYMGSTWDLQYGYLIE